MAEERTFVFANFARSTLEARISASATQLQVAANQGDRFPMPDGTYDEIFSLILSNGPQYEILYCTARSGDFLTVERGKEGSVARQFPEGSILVHTVTAEFLHRLQDNPVPVLASIDPVSTTINTSTLEMTVEGSNFVDGAVVTFNGSPRATVFVSLTELTATLVAGDLDTLGEFLVRVVNPPPGGGTSEPLVFEVTESTGFEQIIEITVGNQDNFEYGWSSGGFGSFGAVSPPSPEIFEQPLDRIISFTTGGVPFPRYWGFGFPSEGERNAALAEMQSLGVLIDVETQNDGTLTFDIADALTTAPGALANFIFWLTAPSAPTPLLWADAQALFEVTVEDVDTGTMGWRSGLYGSITPDPPVLGDVILTSLTTLPGPSFRVQFQGSAAMPSYVTHIRIKAAEGDVTLDAQDPDSILPTNDYRWNVETWTEDDDESTRGVYFAVPPKVVRIYTP